MTEYAAWTTKAVEDRVIEAAETLMLCPRVKGPQQYGNGLPEPVRKMFEDAAPKRARYRKKPEPGALDRMEKTWEWINAALGQEDRILLYTWSRIKVDRKLTLRLYAARNGWSDKELYRNIRRYFGIICQYLNEKHEINLTNVRSVAESAQSHVTSENYDLHWMADNAKPVVDPELPDRRVIKVKSKPPKQDSDNDIRG